METNVNYTAVGAFVIILLACFVLAIVWLSSGFSFDQYSTYLIYMQESVSGLSPDSQVEFNGVDVGSVKSVELNDKNPQLVEVLVEMKKETPVTQGTYATLTSRGLTGVVYIALKDDSSNLEPLSVEPGQIYPVIRTAPSLYVRLDDALEQASKNFKKIAVSIEKLLDPDNQKSIKLSLQNLERVTSTLASNSVRMDEILKNTQAMTYQITPLIQSSMGAVQTLQTQTLPITYKMLTNINNTAINLTELTDKLKKNPSMLIRGVAPPAPGPGE